MLAKAAENAPRSIAEAENVASAGMHGKASAREVVERLMYAEQILQVALGGAGQSCRRATGNFPNGDLRTGNAGSCYRRDRYERAQFNVEVIANNIANINTTGFKRARAEFTDLLYQAERLQGVSNRGRDATIPEGAQIGLGVPHGCDPYSQYAGSLTSTGNKLDLAINGRGWFQIVGGDGQPAYTRDGSFSTNANGQIVTADGYALTPSMQMPQNATGVVISQSGLVTATIPGQIAAQQIGQLTIANFANEAGLEPLGNNLFRETTASGQAVTGAPGDIGFGSVNQGYLENSNVDPVKEITDLIAAQRAYEMNAKVIQAVDDMAGTVSKNLR